MKKADYVSIHVPLLPETKNLIDKEELEIMKKGSYLLNLSRGEVLNIESVKDYLVTKHISGLAVDVFPDEPKSNNEKWKCCLQGLKNVILTPHIGGSTEEAQYRIVCDVSNKILNYINYGNTSTCLSLPNISTNNIKGNIRIINIHKNITGAIMKINNLLNTNLVNIEHQYLSTIKNVGYCIIDISGIDKYKMEEILKKINDLDINIYTRYILPI